MSVLAPIGCRASPKWVLHTGGGEGGPPLYCKASLSVQKSTILYKFNPLLLLLLLPLAVLQQDVQLGTIRRQQLGVHQGLQRVQDDRVDLVQPGLQRRDLHADTGTFNTPPPPAAASAPFRYVAKTLLFEMITARDREEGLGGREEDMQERTTGIEPGPWAQD